MPSNMACLAFLKFSGRSTKSLGCQPDATEMPTRPLERLSTMLQASATRIGCSSGMTTEPARTLTFWVIAATAALVTAGWG